MYHKVYEFLSFNICSNFISLLRSDVLAFLPIRLLTNEFGRKMKERIVFKKKVSSKKVQLLRTEMKMLRSK